MISWKTGFVFTDRAEGSKICPCVDLALKALGCNVPIFCAFSPMVAALYRENRWTEEQVFLETRTGCICRIRASEWDINYEIMYFQLLSQYMETELHIAVLINRLRNAFYPQFLIFIVWTIVIILILCFSELQGVMQNPNAASKGLISAWL